MAVTIQAERTYLVGQKLGQDALIRRLQRWLRILRQQLTCAIVGHEKWEVPCGDWMCMNCSQVRHVESPIYPHHADKDSRRQLDAVRRSLSEGL